MEVHSLSVVCVTTVEREGRRSRELLEQRRAEQERRLKEQREDIRKYGIVEVFRRMAGGEAKQKLTSSPTPRMTIMNDTTPDQQEEMPRTSPAPEAVTPQEAPSPPGIPPSSAMIEV